MSSRVRADLELTRIVIELDKFGKPPTVKLEGRLITPRQPTVGLQSNIVITTRHLGKTGELWINEMRAAFAGAAPAEE
jgi:hypothetical protein